MLKINRNKIFISVLLVVISLLCAFTPFFMSSTNVSAASVPGTEYTITFNRSNFPSDSKVNLHQSVKSITIIFYDSANKQLDSHTRARENSTSWTDNSNAKFIDTNGNASYYTISYTLEKGYYDGVYWQVNKGESKIVTDGAGTVTTNNISLTSTTIDCCDNIMTFVNYPYLSLEVTNSYYYFPFFWDWDIEVTNPNTFPIDMEYLNELCFEGDAKTFGGNTSSKFTNYVHGKGKSKVRVDHNGNAGYVTVCYTVSRIAAEMVSSNCKIITYANNLQFSDNIGTCTVYHNIGY